MIAKTENPMMRRFRRRKSRQSENRDRYDQRARSSGEFPPTCMRIDRFQESQSESRSDHAGCSALNDHDGREMANLECQNDINRPEPNLVPLTKTSQLTQVLLGVPRQNRHATAVTIPAMTRILHFHTARRALQNRYRNCLQADS